MNSNWSTEEVSVEVSAAWAEIIHTVNQVLKADNQFGFENIEQKINPKLSDIIHSLGIIEAFLNTFLDSGMLDIDDNNAVLNSKQCVVHIRQVQAAIESNNKEHYDQAIKQLKQQKKC